MAFEILIEVLNSIIHILNKNKFHLYDYENAEWYLNKIEYRKDEDKLYFKCEGEK